jgi:hypothetical protein
MTFEALLFTWLNFQVARLHVHIKLTKSVWAAHHTNSSILNSESIENYGQPFNVITTVTNNILQITCCCNFWIFSNPLWITYVAHLTSWRPKNWRDRITSSVSKEKYKSTCLPTQGKKNNKRITLIQVIILKNCVHQNKVDRFCLISTNSALFWP